MRDALHVLITVAMAQGAAVALAFFLEPFFPLGDWRWLLVGAGCLAIFIAMSYWEARRRRQPRMGAEPNPEDRPTTLLDHVQSCRKLLGPYTGTFAGASWILARESDRDEIKAELRILAQSLDDKGLRRPRSYGLEEWDRYLARLTVAIRHNDFRTLAKTLDK